MGDWKITVVNKTGDGGLEPETVDFMLFQTVPDLELDSWSSAWEVAEVGYPAQVGPIVLPSKVEFYILDKSHGNTRETGPFEIKFGQTIDITQATKDDAPVVNITTIKAPKGQIKVVNASGNPKPLEFALYKNGKKILSYKNVPPADAVYLAIKPTIYIARVQKGSMKEGEDFKAIVQSSKASPFALYPDQLTVNIGVYQKPSKEIYFQLLPSVTVQNVGTESMVRRCCCLF